MKTRKYTSQNSQNSRTAGKRRTAQHRKTALAGCIFPAVLLGLSDPASATTYTWTKDSAATQDWTTSGNWATSGTFASANDATLQIFSDITTALNPGNNLIITNVPNITLNTLTLNGKGAGATGATNVTLGTSANNWTFDGVSPTINLIGVAGTQALNYTVAPSLILNQNLTVQGAGTAGFTFSGNISGTGGLTKAGASILTLSGSNSFSGSTAVNAGTVIVSGTNALAGTSSVTVANSAKLQLQPGAVVTGKSVSIIGSGNGTNLAGALRETGDGYALWAGGVVVTGACRIGAERVSTSGTLEISGVISGASGNAVTYRNVGGAVYLTGANTYLGQTQIFGAYATDFVAVNSIKDVGVASSLGAQATGNAAIQLGNGANTAWLKYIGTGDTTNRVIDLFATTATTTLDQSGTGPLKFTSNFTATGTGSKTFVLTGATVGTGELAGAVVDNNGSNITSLTKNGAGLWILSGTNTYTGTTTVSAGTLEISSTAALPGATVNGRYSVANGATLAVQNSVGDTEVSAMLSSTNFAAGAAIGYDTTAGNRTLSSALGNTAQGALGLTKLGVNTLTLTGSNTYTGVTTIGGGTLQVGDGVTDGSIASSSIVNNSALVYNVVGSRAAGSAISGSGTLTKNGAGALNLSGASTYTGNTTLTSGTLQLGASGVGTAAAITSSPVGKGTLALNGGTIASDSATARTVLNPVTFGADMPLGDAINSGKLTFSGTADLGGTTRTLTAASTVEFAGPVTNGGIIKSGTGTAILSGTNTFTGAVTVNTGILQAAKDAALSSASAVALNNAGSTLAVNFGGASDYTQTQLGTLLGKTTFGAGTALGIDTTNGSGAYSNAFSMGAGLTKLGANTLTLTGSNTYTGVTTIISGTLQIGDGTTEGSINASSGVVNNGNLTLTMTTSRSFVPSISGTGSITVTRVNGAPSVTLSASNSYTGPTNVAGGELVITNSNALAGTSAVNVTSGDLLLKNGVTITGKTITIAGDGLHGEGFQMGALRNGDSNTSTWAGNVILSANARIGGYQGGSIIVSGTISAPSNYQLILREGGCNVTLSGTSNTYPGPTAINAAVGDVASFYSIKNVGQGASSLGAPANIADGTIQMFGGVLRYLGTGDTTDRVIDLANTTVGVALDQSGTGLLKFTSLLGTGTNSFKASVAASKTLTLQGSTAGTGEIAATIPDNNTASGFKTSLTKAGTGTWTLSGSNSYTGITTINGGALVISNTSALPGWNTNGSYIVNNGGALAVTNSIDDTTVSTMLGTTNFATGGAIGYDTTAGDRTLAGALANTVQGALGLTKVGANTLILTASNSYTGTTTVTNGALQIGDGFTDGVIVSSTAIAANAALTWNLLGDQAYAGTISGSGTLTKNGASTLTLTGINTFTGTTAINSGTLQIGNGTTDGSLASSNSIVNNAALIIAQNGSRTYTGVISGTGTLTKSGTGTLILSASNTYTGGTLVNSGSLQIGNGTTDASISASSGIVDNGTVAFNVVGSAITSAPMSGSGALVKSGSGVLTVTGSHSFSGATTVSAGTLELGNGTAGNDASLATSGIAINSVLRINNYGTQTIGFPITGNGTLQKQGTGTLILTGSLNTGAVSVVGGMLQLGDGTAGHDGTFSTSTVIDNGTLAFNQVVNQTFVNAISGTGSLSKNGANTLTLSGSNTYGGNTAINSGVLSVSSTNSLPGWDTNGRFSVASGATLALGNGFADVSVGTMLSGTNFAAGATLGFDTTSGNRTYAGVIANTTQGVLSLGKIGVNTLTLTGSNSYTGATTISSGILQLGDGTTEGTINASSGVVDNGNLTIALPGVTRTFALPISGTGSFTATRTSGTTILRLTGSNSYTGVTTIAGPEVVISSTNAIAGTSAINVTSGHLLLTNGITVNKTITITGNGNDGDSFLTGALRNGDANTNTWAGNVILGGNDSRIGAMAGTIVVSGTISSPSPYLLTLRTSGGNVTISGTSNTYPGPTNFSGNSADVYSFYSIKNVGGGPSSLGAPTTPANGTMQVSMSVLRYLGTGDTTDRVIDLSNSFYGATLDQSGTGLLKFTSSFLSSSGTSTYVKVLTLQGSTAGTGELGGTIPDNDTAEGNRTALTKAGTSTWTLSGANTYTGATTISAGTLQIGNGTTDGSIDAASAIVDNAALVYNLAGSNNFSNVISGSGTVTKTGPGSLTLSGSNSHTGGTTVNNGTLQLGNANALGTGGLSVNGGALDLNGNNVSVPAFSGAGGAITNSVSGTATLTASVSGTSTYAGNIADGTGSVALSKQGAGKLILSGSLSMAGLNANNGVAELTQSGSIGALTVSGSGAVTVTAHTGGNPYKVLETSSLSITTGGSIDLWNNAMILRASGSSQNATNLATVKAAVNAASNGLQWNGVGIGSTTAFNEAQPGQTQALAVMVYDNTVIAQSNFEGVSGLGYFDSGTPVGFNQVLVKLTYLGDFNADGVINASDYAWLDGFALSGNVLGDLNGDGSVNATDYTWLDGSALNQSFGVLAAQQGGSGILPQTTVAAPNSGLIANSPEAVPEPGALGLLLTGAMGLLGFRRKSIGADHS